MYCKPCTIMDDGKIDLQREPEEWFTECRINGRACKTSAMSHFMKGKNYSHIKYFGDGSNDLCPTMSLTSNDTVFPRIGHTLLKKIESGDHQINAKVCPWNDGFDILKLL